MADNLHCNIRGCNVELNHGVIAMSCRHCICSQCAAKAGFHNSNHLVCPVCETPLSVNDVYQQDIDPSQAWQNLGLCGLHPEAIMSAAKNALAFFTFQMTLQIEFQEAMLEERERYWNFEVTKVFTEASRKIKRLQAKVAGLEETRDNLRQKNEELVLELEDSREQFTRLQTQHHNSRNRITFDLDPTGATHFEDTAAGKDSRLPHMPMPDQLRNTQGSYFPSDTDYPDPDENDHLERTREKTHQARHISRRTHPTGTGAIPGDWNTGPRRDTSIAITKPKGAGITKTSKHISGHKFTRAVSFDQARNRPPSPTAPPEQQVQESSRRFSGAQFGFTSSRAPQQARDTISPKPGGLERRSFRAVPPTTAVERTSTFNRPPLLRRQRLD